MSSCCPSYDDGQPVICQRGWTYGRRVLSLPALASLGADLIEINLNDPPRAHSPCPIRIGQRLGQLVSTIRQAVHAPLAVKLPMSVSLAANGVAAACSTPISELPFATTLQPTAAPHKRRRSFHASVADSTSSAWVRFQWCRGARRFAERGQGDPDRLGSVFGKEGVGPSV